MADIQELYAGRVESASIALRLGDRLEAERLFAEALTMGEENFDGNDPALAVPLNELSRLYVRRSEYARAEPLLNRLLAIRRASGDQHQDVATVLAGLASVRHGLRDDVEAESLYRQALAIREQVLSPDHMQVVVTLEQLADICVARCKFAEAKTLLERALPVREKALGAEHQTVRALRARLTELTAKAAPAHAAAPAPVPVAPMPPAPEEARPSGELVFIYEPEKRVRRPSVKRDRAVTPQFSAAVAAASLITVPTQPPAPPHVPAPVHAAAPMARVSSSIVIDQHEFDAALKPRVEERVAQQRISQERQAYEPVAHAPAARRSQRFEPSKQYDDVGVGPAKKKAGRYGLAAGGVALLAGGIFFTSTRLSGRAVDAAPREEAEVAAVPAPAPVARRAMVAAAPARLAAARADSVHSMSGKVQPQPVAPAAKQAPSGQSVALADARTAAGAAALPALPVIGSVALPETSAPNADSLMRATAVRHDVDNDQIVSAGRLRALAPSDDRAETSPVIIGAVPQPRFPDALRAQGVGGDVVVQFVVGADGSVDVSTMKVVRSPHELFTAAVRNVLPRFRFQPARSADGKAHAETVQYSIQFSATK